MTTTANGYVSATQRTAGNHVSLEQMRIWEVEADVRSAAGCRHLHTVNTTSDFRICIQCNTRIAK